MSVWRTFFRVVLSIILSEGKWPFISYIQYIKYEVATEPVSQGIESRYAPINIMPHSLPLGQYTGKGRGFLYF